jgi:hypothetical protein
MLATKISQPTGVDKALSSGRCVQDQLPAIFRPAHSKTELPFRPMPDALKL